MPGMNLLSRAGADDFFNAVKAYVVPGDVIHIADPAAASLLVGVTGRWTSGGILRDVRSDHARAQPSQCDFAAVLSGGMGMPGPGGQMGQNLPSKFKKVFENEYGALYQNPTNVDHVRQPLAPDVSLPLLLVMALVGFLLVLVDFLPKGNPDFTYTIFSSNGLINRPRDYAKLRLIAAGAGTCVFALCFLPLTSTAIDELSHPPSAQAQRWDDGPGGGGPGFGPSGFGGPGFGGPGQFIAENFLSEADADKNKTVSLGEFKALAGRWFKDWDANHNDNLELDEISQGLQSLFAQQPGPDGCIPAPDGSPGFGPGMFLARSNFFRLRLKRRRKITREEMVGAFEKLFRDWDQDSKGALGRRSPGQRAGSPFRAPANVP